MSKALITETLYGEVVGASRDTRYLEGYGKPPTVCTQVKIKFGDNDNALRVAAVRIPGDLPIGTRFKLELSQVDEVTPATIHRGAIPRIDAAIEGGDAKALESGD